MSKQTLVTLGVRLWYRGGSVPGFLVGGWGPKILLLLHIYSSCCSECDLRRSNINSRGSIPTPDLDVSSEWRVWQQLILSLLSLFWRNICYSSARISSFTGKGPQFFLRNQPFCMLTHSLNSYFFVYCYATNTVLTAEDTAMNKPDRIKIAFSQSLCYRGQPICFRPRWFYPLLHGTQGSDATRVGYNCSTTLLNQSQLCGPHRVNPKTFARMIRRGMLSSLIFLN